MIELTFNEPRSSLATVVLRQHESAEGCYTTTCQARSQFPHFCQNANFKTRSAQYILDALTFSSDPSLLARPVLIPMRLTVQQYALQYSHPPVGLSGCLVPPTFRDRRSSLNSLPCRASLPSSSKLEVYFPRECFDWLSALIAWPPIPPT